MGDSMDSEVSERSGGGVEEDEDEDEPLLTPSHLLRSAQIHWLSILNSVLIVFVLTAMIACILIRALRRDLMRYNALPTGDPDRKGFQAPTDEEKAEEREDFGWKLVHADVFRPPSSFPMLLAVCCGTGAQLLSMR